MEESIPAAERLERGRVAFERCAWGTAFAELSAADSETPLEPEDLDLLAVAADLTGHGPECIDYWTRAHHGFLERGDVPRAFHCAFSIGLCLFFQGEPAQANGWFARGQRLLDEAGLDGVERGYLLIPRALQTYWGGDPAGGHALFEQAAEYAKRFQEPDLRVVSAIGLGETFVRLGEASQGLALMDEAMAIVLSGDASPIMVGLAYCAVLSACQAFFETKRAQEWTRAFTRWCESQQDLVPYRGDCLVYRAELLQLRGSWPDALQVVREACQGLGQLYSTSWGGSAFYQQGEVHRLRGEFAEAEEAYRQASQWGRTPQPGLALLRLAQGRPDAALSAVSRALAETSDRVARSRLLPACAEIALAAGRLDEARAAARELNEVAQMLDVPLLHGWGARATGAVALAEEDAVGALEPLRKALSIWHALEAPYEAARTRTLIAAACSMLGDEDGAELEIDAALQVFRSLGAAPDLERYAAPANGATGPGPAGLTVREVEVLKLVATGKTNHAIAQELVLSDHTVRRHLQNVFAKLGVSSRAAATAFALQHKLI